MYINNIEYGYLLMHSKYLNMNNSNCSIIKANKFDCLAF